MTTWTDLVSPDGFSEQGLVVTNPATGEALATLRDMSDDEINAIIAEADQARGAWASMTAKARAAKLKAWNDLILANQETLAQLITAECGKPLAEARGEVVYGASFLEWFAEESKRVYGDVIPSHAEGKQILVLKQPIGTAAAITPWNFPLAMITRKAGPALAAGCSMVLKPAEATPLTALALETLAHQAGIPAALFRVITTTQPAHVGGLLCASDTIRKLSFTGSTAVGKILMRQSADTMKKLSFELGGNAPFIVFDDADINAAVDGAMVSKYRNAGQTCVCVNRFLVQESVYDDFVAKLSGRVSAMKVGNGAEEGVTVGPLINMAALQKVETLMADACGKGAKIVSGGHRVEGDGAFYAPTVLTEVTPEMAIFSNEIFGPVATVVRFKTEDEAIAIANNTEYGLAAYFYTQNLGRSWRVMQSLEYGMVGVNEGIISTEVAPFGGVKHSGLGREGSKYGIDEYLEIKYCLVGGLT
ncbi:MAG: NAD-dependent succinate-semialdehyde dehydrogenase [Halieaceae bacterium]|nr:NAD-dependent succinate-semialdehyde dehydrogenase [Halieaceae bacterium]MDG0979185.1 NAD-dependent succinate-semialdehyde dehydrogenase [Halieaceae bacterium]